MTSKTIAFLGILCASIPVVGLHAQTIVTHDITGNRTSQAAVGTPVAPTIVAQPSNTLGQVGGFATFSVIAGGTGPFTYQWYENSTAISGATGSTLYITNALSSNFTDHSTGANSYHVTITNSVTTVTSGLAALYLDTNSTGMADWWQIQYFGAIGVSPGEDADNDGVTNLQEYLDGTNPTDPTSRDWFLTVTGPITIQPNQTRYFPGTSVTLTAYSSPGAYFECYTGDLSGTNATESLVMNANKNVVAVASSVITPATAPTLSSGGQQGSVNSIILEGNGQFFVGGRYQTLNGKPQWDLGRVNSDATLDTTYFAGAGAGIGLPNSSNGIEAVAQQADGKLLVAGFAGALPGQYTPSPAIYRVNTDGTIDTSFVASGATYIENSSSAHADIHDIAVLSSGKILIAGDFTTINGVAIAGIARLNSDGSLDTTFNTGGAGLTGFNDFADVATNCLAIDANGLIYIGGEFTAYNGVAETGLARLNANGTLDATFNPGSNFLPNSASATCVLLAPGIGVLLGGDFNTPDGDSLPGVMAFNTNGSLNTNFNLPSDSDISANCFALQANGQILVGDYGTIDRLNTDGSIDNTFDPRFGGSSIVQTVVVQSNGKVLAGGNFSSVNQVPQTDLARINSDGSLDTTAVMNTGVSDQGGYPSILVEESDGKVLVGGGYTLLDNNDLPGLGRLNGDGSFDPTFNPGGTGANNLITAVVPTGNKIFIGGYFNQYNGTTARGYAQLNLDGTLDSTFTPGPQDGSVSDVTSAVLLSNGEFIMAGRFQSGTSNLERLSATGTVDTTYLGQTNGQVNCEVLQPDGKLLIGGFFLKVDGVTASYLARLMPDGSLDTTFNPTALRSTSQSVSSMALLPSGQILVSLNSGPVQRLNSDGSTDSTYVNLIAQYSIYSSVNCITALPDGSALLGGTFVYTGTPPAFPYTNSLNEVVQYFIKLTPTGAPDPTFNPDPNAAPVAALALSDGEIYVSGPFSSDAAENAVGLVRLSASPFLQLGPVGLAPAAPVGLGTTETLTATAASSQGTISNVVFESSTDNVNFTAIAVGTSTGSNTYTASWTPAATGTYYLRTYVTDSVLNTGESVAVSTTVVQNNTSMPQITAQPQNVSIALGSPASFNVTATGGGLSYQWQYDGAPLSGQTSATLSLGNATLTQAGNYNVVVSNNVGMVTSSTAILAVSASVAAWDGAYGVSGDSTTPQHDGVPNLLKYFFDVDPSEPMTGSDRAALPVLKTISNNGNNYLTLTFREYSAAAANSVVPTLQSSTDLATWSTVPSNQFFTQQIGNDPVTGDPIMEMGAELNGASKLFIRLRITGP